MRRCNLPGLVGPGAAGDRGMVRLIPRVHWLPASVLLRLALPADAALDRATGCCPASAVTRIPARRGQSMFASGPAGMRRVLCWLPDCILTGSRACKMGIPDYARRDTRR